MRTLRSLWAIGQNTYREAVRNKVFGSLVFAAVFIIGVSLILGQMSLHEEVRVTTDFAYFSTAFFSTLIAIYSTVTLLHNEIDDRTLYTILSKPTPRWTFLLGKYLGVVALLATIVFVLGLVSTGLVFSIGGNPNFAWYFGHVTILLQLMIVVSVALFFASFSTPLLSGLLTGLLWTAGNLRSQLEAIIGLMKEKDIPAVPLLEVVQGLLPNLESLNLSAEITHNAPVPAMYVWSSVWYAVSYSAVVLVLSAFIFGRRDFA
jgi:ABC-type transport system involved in multi-copper enzyme maturation permease subunit